VGNAANDERLSTKVGNFFLVSGQFFWGFFLALVYIAGYILVTGDLSPFATVPFTWDW
jgi:hypothetical protein